MLSLRIALRYLFAKKSHTAVNIISMISMAGVGVAAMAMVCVLSVFNGFADLATERLSNINPDISITPAEGAFIANGDSLAAAAERLPQVERALPMLTHKGLAVFSDAQMPVTVVGLPDEYAAVSRLDSTILDGVRTPDISVGGRTIPCATLSIGVALGSGARPGPESGFTLTVPRRLGRINPAFPLGAFVSDTLAVSGVFQTNDAEFDTDVVCIPLDRARRLFDFTTEASAIQVSLPQGVAPRDAVAAISAAIGDGYIVADRLAQQEESFRMIHIEKWITFLMLMFVLVMASFNILSTMSMLIIEKEESIAILRSLGAPFAMRRRIFMNEALLIAAIGGAVGIIVGIILCLLQQHFGLIELAGDPSRLAVHAYPCRLAFTDILLVAAVVGVIGSISGFITSRTIKG